MRPIVDRRETPARPGLLIDGYALVARRSDHGLGDAWLAQRPHQPDDEALVKFVAPLQGDAVVPRAFDETLRKVQRATSPGLVNVRRWGVAESWLYVVTEVIEARPLDDWIAGYREAATRPPPGVVLWLFDSLCAAVQSAHRQGIVHGAISPRSVLLHPLSPGAYHAWILDLGLAQSIQEAAAVSVIEPAPQGYLAPEQLDPREPATARSDLFALSVLLVELLTLNPSPGSASREPLARVVLREHGRLVEHLKRLRDDVPEDFWSALAETLHPDPSRRPESAQQLKSRVRNAAVQAALWRDVPEPAPEPPVPSSARGAAGDPVARGSGAAPEGWQHAERLPSKVDPEALKSMLSVAARKRRSTNTGTAIVAPPPSPSLPPSPAARPSPAPAFSAQPYYAPPAAAPATASRTSPVPSFASHEEAAEGTTRTSSEALVQQRFDAFEEGTARRPSISDVTSPATLLPEGQAPSQQTLQPGYGWNLAAVLEAAAAPVVPVAPSPAPQSPSRRQRAQTRAIDEEDVSDFLSSKPESRPSETVAASRAWSPPPSDPGYDDATTRPAVDPSDFEVDTTLKAPRAGPIPATIDMASPVAPLLAAARPATMPPPSPSRPDAFATPRPMTVPPPSYAPPMPTYAKPPTPDAFGHVAPPAAPFVLKPLDRAPAPPKRNGALWIFLLSGVIVVAAAVIALLIVLS
ncbi:MAG: protein kinase [Polyangiales bacterium]